jgi:outer membrane protein OmpA-like peptidoglycan-associated protein
VKSLATLMMVGFAGIALGQTQHEEPAANVIHKSIISIGYPVGDSTKVIFTGTALAPQASGAARVEAKPGSTKIRVDVKGLPQPMILGPEFLTYVLWSVTPDGNVSNLGEIWIDKEGDGYRDTQAPVQTFAMAITAEPYFAVRLPSEEVVLVNDATKGTKGKIFPENSYKLMARSQYAKEGNPLALTLDTKNTPFAVYQARNAVEIAKARGAEQYAPDIYKKAVASLQMTENLLARKADKDQIVTSARQTMQFAEDARSLSAQNREAERIQAQQDAAAAAAAAKAKSEADAQAAAESKRQAELTAAREAQMKSEADAATAEARAKEDVAKAEAQRVRAAADAARAQLLAQLNSVLETKDTPRGLVVSMADVLFETGKYSLSTDAQLKLAKLAGIIQAHPGLNLAIEGYTDATGGNEMNLKLSQQRAEAVREFLVAQGLPANVITATGFGEANPIADNATPAGRKANRRVEIILSGEVIGAKLGK